MQKIKRHRSADCVIGGFRYSERAVAGRKVVGSLLLGLYDDKGMLHHVGFTSAIKAQEKPGLTARLEAIVTDRSFTGNMPGGPSRWSTKRSSEWTPVTLTSHLGLSGTNRLSIKIESPNTPPIPKPSRQPTLTGSRF
jgi:ATP-dependent DNA ligase